MQKMEQNSPSSPFWVLDMRSGYYQIPIRDSHKLGAFQSHTPNEELGNCEECKRLKDELEICNKRLEESEKGRADAELLREIAEAELTSLKEIRERRV